MQLLSDYLQHFTYQFQQAAVNRFSLNLNPTRPAPPKSWWSLGCLSDASFHFHIFCGVIILLKETNKFDSLFLSDITPFAFSVNLKIYWDCFLETLFFLMFFKLRDH